MAGFVQIIEYRTQKADEITALMDEFQKTREAAGDGPAPTRGITCADRDEPGRYARLCLRRLRYFVLFDETNPKTRSTVYRAGHLALSALAQDSAAKPPL